MFKIDNTTQAMTIIKKDTASFVISLDNYSLTDGEDIVIFTVSDKLEQKKPLIQKEITSFTLGTALISLDREDTENMDIGNYFYDIQVNLADGRVDTIIGPAIFRIEGGVTY